MTTAEVKEFVAAVTPYSADEISEEALEVLLKEVVKTYNQYRPKVERLVLEASSSTYTFSDPPEAVFRVLADGSPAVGWRYLPPNLYLPSPGRYVVFLGRDWTPEEISLKEPYFSDLLRAGALWLLSADRRSVRMDGLPFDLKGDQFYSDGLQEWREALERLAANPSVV